jgi:hypothetical protein
VGNGRHVLAANAITFVVIFLRWTLLKYLNAVNVEIIVNRIQNKANDSSVMQSVQAIRNQEVVVSDYLPLRGSPSLPLL